MAQIREDKKEMQEKLLDITRAVAPILPENWDKYVIGFFLVGEELFEKIQIHTHTAKQDWTDEMEKVFGDMSMVKPVSETKDACMVLHDLCAASQDDWTSLSLCVKRDGSFRMECGYDPIQNYDRLFIMEWQSRYLD